MTPQIIKLVAPILLGVAPIFGEVWGADGVSIKFSGRERIVMPATSDVEKEWEKTGLLGGSRQKASEPNTTFIPSGGVTVLKDPLLLKFLSERQNWLSPKNEAESGPSAEEKAFGIRDYTGKITPNSFGLDQENSKTSQKNQKKDPALAPSWEALADQNSSRLSKNNPNKYGQDSKSGQDQSETANMGYSSSSAALPSIASSPLPDFYRIGDSRANSSLRQSSATAFSSPTDLGAMPSMPEAGSLFKMDRMRQMELQKKAQFQQLLQPKGTGMEPMAGANDPINLWQDGGRVEANPVTGAKLDDMVTRNRNEIFGFSPLGGPAAQFGRSSLFDSLDPKSQGQSSLTPVLAPVAAPEFRPKPGILEMPLRRKF